MSAIQLAYPEAPNPQPANQLDSSPPLIIKKRPSSESRHSSYGESDGTPTPKRRRLYSRPGFSSESSSSTFHSTPPSAQVPRQSSMENSEDEDESDGVYDEFDLGDFTKEEIKRYESMVGPEDRLRDAAPPEEPSELAPETTAGTDVDSLGASFIDKLPREFHDMLAAALSNTAYRLSKEHSISIRGYGIPDNGEDEFEMAATGPDEFDMFATKFWCELTEPVPEMKRFIRRNQLRQDIYGCHTGARMMADPLLRDYGRWTPVAHRIFEQQVYDFGRSLGLSKEQATGHVIKAREDSSKCDVDLMDLGDYESSECEEILNYLYTLPEPDVLPPFVEKSKGFMFVSEDNIQKFEDLLTYNLSKAAKQVLRYVQTLKDNNLRSEYEMIILRLRFHENEPLIDNINGLREKIEHLEEADKAKEERSARKNAKKTRKAERRAQKKALGQVKKKNSQKSTDPQAGMMPKEQKLVAIDSEPPAQVHPIEDRDEPPRQKRKGRKRKSELQLPIQSEAPSAERDKHKQGTVVGDAQDTTSQKAKRKRDVGPQHSPFFQRSSGLKAKKNAIKKAEPLMGFQSPMIQSLATDHPSQPVTKKAPNTVVSPPSDDISSISCLRSTPSLSSFSKRENDSDNTALACDCALSEPNSSTRKLSNDPTGLPSPTPSFISLQDLNKRLLERTIYQDGIVLTKPEALADLSISKKPRKRSVTVSPFFTRSPSKKSKASDKISCIPFPPLQSTSFGLVQERLSHDPFRLLIAVIFLNKTRGSVALPVFYELMERYPTPADLAAANQADVVQIIQHLGLQNQRAKKCINLAKAWLERPPEKGKRYRVLHYPKRDDGKDVRPDEILGEEDKRVAWEIGQLPGIGVYAIDSWRIFCRDELRGLPNGLPKELTPEAKEEELQKEWTRVLAGDKELRAYLRWRWLRNGWEWDPVTGERRKADEHELANADKGGIIYEGDCGDMFVGGIKGGGPKAVKAEVEVGEEVNEMETGPVEEDIIVESDAADVLERKGEEPEEATTTVATHQSEGVGEPEENDGKAAIDEPEKRRRCLNSDDLLKDNKHKQSTHIFDVNRAGPSIAPSI